jgi:hypothetical protein
MQENSGFVLDKLAISIVFALLVGVAVGITLYGLRASLRRVHDSESFREALQVWMPVVQRRRGTPRGIKRFGNRLRYLAMLQQHADLDETGFDKLRRRLIALSRPFRKLDPLDTKKRLSQAIASAQGSIPESLLVALASVYEVHGSEWRSYLRPDSSDNFEKAIQTAIKSYEQMTSEDWPPSDANLATFERLLSGVRIA